MTYTGQMFSKQTKAEPVHSEIDLSKLVAIQCAQLRETYRTECLNAKQLQRVLNIGESNVYAWIKKCPSVRIVGRRKVVPIIAVASFLVTGEF